METALQQKWEYLVEEISNLSALRESLSRLGAEGWELVNVVRGAGMDQSGPVKTLRVRKGDTFCAFFKRPGF